MGALDAFYSTWSDARETFGQGTPQDGSNLDNSSKLMQMKAGVEAAAPDGRWQGPASEAYAAKNKDHAGVYGKLAELDTKMATEVTNASNVVKQGRQSLENTKSWVDSAANSIPTGTSATDRNSKLLSIANQGIGQVSNIVTEATNKMTEISQSVQGLKGRYDAIANGKPDPGENTPGEKPGEKPDMLGAWQDRKSDSELVPEDMEGLVHDALNGNQEAAAKVDNLLDNIDEDQLGPKSVSHPLSPLQAELVGQLQAQMKPMSMEDLNKARDKLGPHKGILGDAMQIMSDPDVTYPRHDGDGPEVITPGVIHNDGVLPGDRGALPDSVQSALNAKLDLDAPSGMEIARGHPTPFGDTQGAKDLVDLSTIVGDGDRKFQQGSEIDRGLMARGQEILEATDGATRGDAVAERIFETAGRDKVVDHDMFTKNPGFIEDVLTHPWQDDGKAASTLTDWIKEDANSADPLANSRAGETARAIANYMGDSKTPLLDMNGGDQPLGKVNPELTQSLARAMSPYLDEMTGYPLDEARGLGLNPTTGFGDDFERGDAKSPKTVNILTILDTDDSAARIINGKSMELQNSYINEYASSLVENPEYPEHRTALESAGKLKGMTENALVSASNDVIHDKVAASERVSSIINGTLDSLGSLPGAPGNVIGMASPAFKEFISSFEFNQPPENVPTRSSIAMQTMLADTFMRAGLGPPEGMAYLAAFDVDHRNGLDIPQNVGSTEYNNYKAALENYLGKFGDPVTGPIGAYNTAYRDALAPTADK